MWLNFGCYSSPLEKWLNLLLLALVYIDVQDGIGFICSGPGYYNVIDLFVGGPSVLPSFNCDGRLYAFSTVEH